MNAQALAFFSAVGFAACSGPGVESTTLDLSITFPDGVGSENQLPLDTADGFPFRVALGTQLGSLHGTLKAHVFLVGAAAGDLAPSGTAPNTDVVVSLNDEGSGTYGGNVRLNAPNPGELVVQAEVAGQTSTATAIMPSPVLKGAVAATTVWSGSTARYSVCIETSSEKGTIDLASADSAVLAQLSTPAGTLVPGPCTLPPVPNGSGVSHANFVVAFPPPFTVTGTLRGKPVAADPAPWTCAVSADTELVPTVNIDLRSASTGVVLTTGSLFSVTLTATSTSSSSAMTGGTPIAGANVVFSVFSSSASSAPTLSPTSAMTGVDGKATAFVVLAPGAQVAIAATVANATVSVIVQGQ
ncbi:MAG: hypothetical protein WCG85_05835 [Polyangia bacterium]